MPRLITSVNMRLSSSSANPPSLVCDPADPADDDPDDLLEPPAQRARCPVGDETELRDRLEHPFPGLLARVAAAVEDPRDRRDRDAGHPRHVVDRGRRVSHLACVCHRVPFSPAPLVSAYRAGSQPVPGCCSLVRPERVSAYRAAARSVSPPWPGAQEPGPILLPERDRGITPHRAASGACRARALRARPDRPGPSPRPRPAGPARLAGPRPPGRPGPCPSGRALHGSAAAGPPVTSGSVLTGYSR